ncbi:hypothetical protein BW898_16035 [Bacillus cereus]|nr:hypothetical protein BW898_16035 [Bacillus cereus]
MSRASPQMRKLLLQKKEKKLSEYKAVYMIQDHLYLAYEALQKGKRNFLCLLPVLLFYLINCKSDR